MDELKENHPEQRGSVKKDNPAEQIPKNVYGKPQRKKRRYSSPTIKALVIGCLVLLLLVPMFMIQNMISERGRVQEDAIDEVSQKWSLEQTIAGPYINFQFPFVGNKDGQRYEGTGNAVLLPDELFIDGQLKTEILKRGIYEVNVYQSEFTIKGSFSLEELKKSTVDVDVLQFDKAAVCLNLTDLRGIGEQISIKLNDSVYVFEPGVEDNFIDGTGIHTIVDMSVLKEMTKIPYEMKIKLKGSQAIHFIPLGKTTHVKLKANWGTPSFIGNYLPNDRTVTENDFSAQWQVLNMNRNYPQVLIDHGKLVDRGILSSGFGVNLKIPVEQYQQSTRSAKYAILIILLTFVVIFFTEIMNRSRVHALQYLLVGLALCLFYSLLLSFSEHIGFNMAYLLAAVLTIALVGGYMFGIIKKKKPAFVMVGLLSVLYVYIFILIQLETYALLAGSLGLFAILAIVMYFSKKIDWFNE